MMKNMLLWKSGIWVHYCAMQFASLKDVIHTTTRGQERCQSIGITILTGSDAPMMTAQVNIYLRVRCVGYTEKEESC